MTALRSALFMLIMIVVTGVYATGMLTMLWLPDMKRRQLPNAWVRFTLGLAKHLLGIDYRFTGLENIPKRSCIILCKHQSAWETMGLQLVFRNTIFVYKRELHYVPFVGWALWMLPFVAIDRKAGKDALSQVEEIGKRRLAEGFSVIVFPEGTRVAPGKKKRYKIGGAYLAEKSGAPVVPVAHNAGDFWSRQAFIKRPGTVTVSIGPVIDPIGRSAEDINRRAEEWIENEMRRISPQHYIHEKTQPATGVAA